MAQVRGPSRRGQKRGGRADRGRKGPLRPGGRSGRRNGASAWGWLSRAEFIGLGVTLSVVGLSGRLRRLLPGTAGRSPGHRFGATRQSSISPGWQPSCLPLGWRQSVLPMPSPARNRRRWKTFSTTIFAAARPRRPRCRSSATAIRSSLKLSRRAGRITLPATYIHPWGGVGFQTAIAVAGDFEITATVDILHADRPPTGIGVGAAGSNRNVA